MKRLLNRLRDSLALLLHWKSIGNNYQLTCNGALFSIHNISQQISQHPRIEESRWLQRRSCLRFFDDKGIDSKLA